MPYPIRNAVCFLFVCTVFMFSCTRDADDVIPPPPTPEDTTGINNPNTPGGTDTPPSGWKKIQLNTQKSIIDIVFHGDTGYCFGENELYRSVDGGDNWEKILTASERFENIGMGMQK